MQLIEKNKFIIYMNMMFIINISYIYIYHIFHNISKKLNCFITYQKKYPLMLRVSLNKQGVISVGTEVQYFLCSQGSLA